MSKSQAQVDIILSSAKLWLMSERIKLSKQPNISIPSENYSSSQSAEGCLPLFNCLFFVGGFAVLSGGVGMVAGTAFDAAIPRHNTVFNTKQKTLKDLEISGPDRTFQNPYFRDYLAKIEQRCGIVFQEHSEPVTKITTKVDDCAKKLLVVEDD